MLFLAYAGSNSGAALAEALGGPTGPRLFAVGIIVTVTTAAFVLIGGRLLAGIYGPRMGGVLAGTQTQPAVLAYANEQTRRDSLAAAVTAGRSAFELARFQYNSGLVSFQTVLDTQRTQLTTQESVANATIDLGADHVRLYKALGGGWNPNDSDAATASAKPS